jgi:SnoaL-like domain
MGATTRPHTHDLFATVDSMDVATIASLFAADSRVIFGNGQPMVGIDELRSGITAFYDTIAGLHHEIVNEWNVGDDAIVEEVVPGLVELEVAVPRSRPAVW